MRGTGAVDNCLGANIGYQNEWRVHRFWRLMGGRQFDLALQNVIFMGSMLSFSKRIVAFSEFSFILRLLLGWELELESSIFSGSMRKQGSLWTGARSFLGVPLRKWFLVDQLIIQFIFWSQVGGNSSRKFLLAGLEVLATFLYPPSSANKSLFVSSLVSNLRFRKFKGPFILRVFSGLPSSSRAKKEVFSGEQINLQDSIFFE